MAKPYQVLTISLNLAVLFIAWIVLFFVRCYYMYIIETLFPQIEDGNMLPAFIVGCILFVLVSIMNIIAIRRKIMRIWYRKD